MLRDGRAVPVIGGRRDATPAGVALGLGVLLKYLPIVLLPFLAVSLSMSVGPAG